MEDVVESVAPVVPVAPVALVEGEEPVVVVGLMEVREFPQPGKKER